MKTTENEIQLSDSEKKIIINFLGHELTLRKKIKCNFGEVRYFLDCYNGCCTYPCGMMIQCTQEDLNDLICL